MGVSFVGVYRAVYIMCCCLTEFLTEAVWLSVDPYMRWVVRVSDEYYFVNTVYRGIVNSSNIGNTMIGEQVAKLV